MTGASGGIGHAVESQLGAVEVLVAAAGSGKRQTLGVVGPHDAASESGLHGLTHFLASRLASSGVTVNTLAPALITDTRMLPASPRSSVLGSRSAGWAGPRRSRIWRSRYSATRI